ncbi:uncharacterized protein C8orf58 homolog [Orycteropus afer afer]|uniref:Uncharacterized protein C8orf58 homolog n=1 Tax=Orycteropus afer afer TaxID=1230840 RepID=A0AC54ZD51_ORYAF|nr:uncharacterized protein C8orf58 homolog [Orycteropus afer afer]
MLGRRRVFAVEARGGPDRAGGDLAHGCVVPGVISTYRRIQDTVDWRSSDAPWNGDSQPKSPGRPVPLLKMASQDSGVEIAVGHSSLAISQGLSQDSLDLEHAGSSEPPALTVMEAPAQLGRLLASHKLERVLERSCQLPTSPTSLSQQHHPLQLPSQPECEVCPFGARELEVTEAEAGLEAGLGEADMVSTSLRPGKTGGLEPEVWTSLPGQGLLYLEHLCLVLEQMARLQQLYLQLQTQRPAEDPEESAPPSPSHALGNEVQWDLLSQTKETGAKAASFPKVGMPSTNPPNLPEAPAEPNHTFPSSQGHKLDLSHWDKVKILLNRIRWRSSRHPEPPPSDGPDPRIESRDFPERPQCRPQWKTFMPSLVVKKQRAKNLSVC